MTQLQFKLASHLDPALIDSAARKIDAAGLAGRWVNTNHETRGISELTVEHDGQNFSVSLVGVGAAGPIDWPLDEVETFANLEEEGGQRAVALVANVNFGFMASEIQIRVNKGVLVIVLFNTFRDGSGRSNYVTREFFNRPA